MDSTSVHRTPSTIPRQSSVARHTASSAMKMADNRTYRSDAGSPVKLSALSMNGDKLTLEKHIQGSLRASRKVTPTAPIDPALPTIHANQRRAMDKCTSMNDIAGLSNTKTRHPPRTTSLYLSTKSPSMNTLASRTSPRRNGLGARTVSPTELRKKSTSAAFSTKPKLAFGTSPAKTTTVPTVPIVPKSLATPKVKPSPVPPVPPLPPAGPRAPYIPLQQKESRSISGPAILARQRSTTLSNSASDEKLKGQDIQSFTSPMKASVPQHVPATQRKPQTDKLQAVNLPPLNLQGLSKPTIQRVNDMSERLRDMELGIQKNQEQLKTNLLPAPADRSSMIVPDREDKRSIKEGRKSSNGFFNRLSLSRASSFRKSRAGKREDADSDELTPEKGPSKRRLSLTWLKGRKSPFGSNTTPPKFDLSAPPAIPKSFTSESLNTQLNATTTTTPVSAVSTLSPLSASTTDLKPGTPLTQAADEEMRKALISRKGSGYLSKIQSEIQMLQERARVVTPVESTQAAILGGSPLNIYEKGEIIDYDGKIYFTGQRGTTKAGGRLDATNKINFGYDDERGDYVITAGDHFAYRYEIVDVLGKGSFGQVLRCIDYRTGGLVAVKIIRNKKRFHAQALVEVNILQRLREWDPEDKYNLIRYTDHFYFRHHLCIATDLLGMNLYEYIKANDFKGCTITMIRSFSTQILSCLSLLRKQRVIHCDLKPENILLVNMWESKIKIIDFGSSCFEDQKVYTYIQSRFYRSPEVILGMSYGLPIDMWSMGCILAELFTGYPLFPGEDEQEQLSCIMEIFGPPEKHLIENSTRKKLFFDSVGKPRSVVTSKGRRRKPTSKTLAQSLKCHDEAFLDFLARCLRWNPAARLNPDDALQHPFITGKPLRTESPMKKKLFSSTMTPRPLPSIPLNNNSIKVKNGMNYRTVSGPMMSRDRSSPSKHKRILSSLPVPRDRVIT